MFGPIYAVASGAISNAGRQRLPTRVMVALLYLKHSFNESDEDVMQLWGETPTWQYFPGNEYFEHQLPCDSTQLGRFRSRPSKIYFRPAPGADLSFAGAT